MSLNAVLNLAKDAIFASQTGLTVTGHNISNVSTEGYSKQVIDTHTNRPMTRAGLQMGMGAKVDSVLRSSDKFLEGRLLDQKSELASFKEKELYLNNLESIFNTDQKNSLNELVSQFWNKWHDLGNNPAGAAERKITYEFGFQIVDQFNSFNDELGKLDLNLTSEIETGVKQVNSLVKEIALVNDQIRSVEVSSPANDQRDRRGQLITQLSEMMDIKVIEQPDNSVTILTAGGYPLVSGNAPNELAEEKGRVQWIGSGGQKVDISDDISGGKLNGWLEMKDEVVKKLSADLDSLAKEMTWQVNKVHSQGVGKSFYSTDQTGTYAPQKSNLLSTLPFGDRIDNTKDFKVWVKDSQDPPVASSITVDMGISTAKFSNFQNNGTALPAATANFRYEFTVTKSGSANNLGDDPVISWEKFDANGNSQGPAANVTIANDGTNINIGDLSFDISEGTLIAGNTFTVNTDSSSNPKPLNLTADMSKPAASVLDTYTFEVASGNGNVADVAGPPKSPIEVKWSNSISSGTFVIEDPKLNNFEVDGMSISFNSGNFKKGDVFTLKTDSEGFPKDKSGNFSVDSPSSMHWTTDSLKDQFNRQAKVVDPNMNVEADINEEGQFQLKPKTGYSFAFSDTNADDSGVTAALGINTFFTGSKASDMKVNSVMADFNNIAAGKINGGDVKGITSDNEITAPIVIDATNRVFTFEENGGTTPTTVTLSLGTYDTKEKLHSLAADIQTQMNGASNPPSYKVRFDTETNRLDFSENDGSKVNNLNILWGSAASTAAGVLGFQADNERYIPPTGEHGVSDNTTALAIADLKFKEVATPQKTFDRGNSVASTTVNATIEGYFQETVSSLGVTSASIKRGTAFSQNLVTQLTQQRESISGVSLDEEMIRLIKFQQSYTAAAKLISTSDEMMQTLLAVK